MTKQETIKQAYGEYWELIKNHIDENGWVDTQTFSFARKGIEFDFYKKRTKSYLGYYNRPKSLEGLENNNGWIKIESEEDLPNNSCSCWIQVKYQYTNTPFWYDFTKKCFVFKGIILFTNEITHYKPIEKPKPPLY